MPSNFCRWARCGWRAAIVLCLTVCVWSCFLPAGWAQIPVAIHSSAAGAVITAAGQPFAEYLKRSGFQPAIWPIVGPTGQEMTRSYPAGPLREGEVTDHPHHRSLWFSHGNVNGLDFWSEFENATEEERAQRPVIAHRTFEKLEPDGDCALLVSVNDWLHQGQKICEDQRTVRFGADPLVRWIDFQIVLKATDGDVTFGDTKEGSFGIRVPETMKVDAQLGGEIVNSNGQSNEDAWGVPAAWVQYRGPVEGKPLGITIVNHPSSFRYPTRWHVRTYGLFAANPFGEREFPPADSKHGEYTLPKGQSLLLRYLVLLHKREMSAETILSYQQQFTPTE